MTSSQLFTSHSKRLTLLWLPLVFIVLAGCSSQTEKEQTTSLKMTNPFENIPLDQKYTFQAVVDINDPQAYQTIGEAINSAPDNSNTPFRIKVVAGDYYEKITVAKPYITLIGESSQTTRLYYDSYAGKIDETGKKVGTTGSATLTIKAPHFSVENMHIANSFNFPYFSSLEKSDPAYVSGLQAVALKTAEGSDKALFSNVTISGYQDTLYPASGRALFVNTTISGHVDFIFGGGTAVFYKSNIVTRARAKSEGTIGYITAPSTQISQPYGLVFINSALSSEADVKPYSVGLGRPWHPTTQFSDGRYADPNAIGQTVFINTWMGKHIEINPWHPMGGTLKSGEKGIFKAEDARFFEYNSEGPGAHKNEQRRQLSDTQAATFTLPSILGSWYESQQVQAALAKAKPWPALKTVPGEMQSFTVQNEYKKLIERYPFIRPISTASTEDKLKIGGKIESHLNLKYKTINQQALFLDLFKQAKSTELSPVVVMIHGGGWRTGNKSHQVPTAKWLASKGYVGVSVQYRLSDQALYPAGLDDINDAIRWLKDNHKKFAIDPNKVAILGASSGAHMATLLGAQGSHDMLSGPYKEVQAIINIDGVANLASEDARVFEDKPNKISYAALWLGGRYVNDPASWHKASPTEYLSKNTPPILFVNSSYDRFHVGRDTFISHLDKYNTYYKVHTIPDTPHTFWLFHPWVDNMRTVLLQFLDKTLKTDDEASANADACCQCLSEAKTAC